MSVSNSQGSRTAPGGLAAAGVSGKRDLINIERRSNAPAVSRFTRKPTEAKQEAEGNSSGLRNETDFCLQLLAEGYVQSYVDFYHLTHRTDPHHQGSNSNRRIQHTIDEMLFIRNNLVHAEISRRQGNTSGVYSSYHKLADAYTLKMDWKTAIFFLDKCLEISQLTTDMKAEMAANHSLGVVYQRMGDFDTARAFHEAHEKLANSVDADEELERANGELCKVYWVIAERYENNSNGDEVIELFKKCMVAAVRCNNKSLEGEANGKIGQIMLRRGEAFDSIPFLTNHAQISAELGDAEARCRACSSLAYALDSLGENDRALTQLRLVHAISEQAGDIYLQSQACRALGTLYSKVGKLKDAMDSLERHFELVKAIMIREKFADNNASTSAAHTSNNNSHHHDDHSGQKQQQKAAAVERTSLETLDMARVYVGISRGNYFMNAYMQAIEFEMGKLLNWKLTRAELIPTATVTTSLL